MGALDDLVPSGGRVLDIGCGHGVLSLRLAISSPARTVVGVDVDGGRLRVAAIAAEAGEVSDRLSFEHVGPRWLPPADSFDAVVISDVLYLLGREHRAALLRAAAAAAPRGTVVVKEMADRPVWKRRLTEAQERLSVSVARITEGAAVDLATEDEILAPLLAAGSEVERHDLSAGRLHPHVAFVATGAALGVASADETSVLRWGR
jgi:ubiquinone/menaquinone biosynthesis C-methylase UbiE